MMKYSWSLKTSFFYLSLALIFVNACSGNEDPDPAENGTTTIQITTVGDSGEKKSGVTVYLFQNPATQSDGINPLKALKKVASDQNGIATFQIGSLTQLQSGQTVYFTAIEKSFTGDDKVAGTTEVTLAADQATIEKE